MSDVSCIILAGGSGTRFGGSLPKQFSMLAGRPVIEYAIDTLSSNPRINRLVVVHGAGMADRVSSIVSAYRERMPILLAEGGGTRNESTLAGLQALESFGDHKVIVHDAARPFVTQQIVNECINVLDTHDACDVVVPATDTVVEVDGTGCVVSVPPRASLRRGQTPQGFWLSGILRAYASTSPERLATVTDDVAVLLASLPKARVACVEGDERNLKLTNPLDQFLAEQIILTGYGSESGGERGLGNRKLRVAAFGGTSGIGLAACRALAARGHHVNSCGLSSGVDVRDRAAVSAFLDQAAEGGPIDTVMNFSGVLHAGSLSETDWDDIDAMIATNLSGTVNVARCSHRHLLATRGQLILVSSSSYSRGRAGTAVYSATKAAVTNLAQALSDEWLPDGIAVSCVVPRRCDTPMRRAAFPGEDPATLLSPEAVANAAVEMAEFPRTGAIRSVY